MDTRDRKRSNVSAIVLGVIILSSCSGSGGGDGNDTTSSSNISSPISDYSRVYALPEKILENVPLNILEERSLAAEPLNNLYINEYLAFGKTQLDLRAEIQYNNLELGTVITDTVNVKSKREDTNNVTIDSVNIGSNASSNNYIFDIELDSETQRITQFIMNSQIDQGEEFLKVEFSYSLTSDAVSLCYSDYSNNVIGSVRFSVSQNTVYTQNAIGYCQDANDFQILERIPTNLVSHDQFGAMFSESFNLQVKREVRSADEFTPQDTHRLMTDLGKLLSVQGGTGAALVAIGMLSIETLGFFPAAAVIGIGIYLVHDALHGLEKSIDSVEGGFLVVDYDDRVFCRNNGIVPPCVVVF